MMINQALKSRALPIPPVPSHDWWLLLVASAFGVVEHVPVSLIKYRQHGHNAIGLGGFGQSASRRLLSAIRSPGKFLSARRKAADTLRRKIDENMSEFSRRYRSELELADRNLVDELCKPGRFIGKLRLFDQRKAGQRWLDFVILVYLLSQPGSSLSANREASDAG